MMKTTILKGLALMALSFNAYSATDVLYKAASDYSVISLPMKLETTSASPTGARVFTSTAAAGSVNYKFELKVASTFQIEAYVLSDSTSRNAIGIAVDDGTVANWDLPINSAYEWKIFSTVYTSKAGVFEVSLTGVDAYTRIAAIRIAKIAETPAPTPVVIDVLYREAADYNSIVAPFKMEITSSSPTGKRVYSTQANSGSIKYKFDLSAASPVKIEAYVLAEGATKNSLGLAVNGAASANWDLDVSSAYTWRTFPTIFAGQAGSNEIVINGAEAYTRIAAVRIVRNDGTVVTLPLVVTAGSLVSVNEGVASLLTINKVAGTAAGTVDYQVLNNATKAVIASGSVAFAANDTSKTISILAPDDNVYTADMKLEIKIASLPSIVVSVVDNDSPTAPVTGSALRIASEPSSGFFGKKLTTLSIEMVNSNGIRISDNSSVIVASLKEAGILSGTKSARMVNGLATFSNLTVMNGSLVNKLAFKSGTFNIDSENIEFQDFSPIDSDAVITSTVNATSLANAVTIAKTAAPGTRILVPNETVKETSVLGAKVFHYNFNASGSLGKPIIIEPLNAGGVILSGTSKVKLSGKYLVFKGFKHLNIDPGAGYGGDLSLIKVEACDHCAIRGIRIEGGPLYSQSGSEDAKHFKYILINPDAYYTEVSNSTFIGKRNAGSVILVNRDAASTAVNGHRIYRNQFLDRTLGGNGLNDFDVIRVGDSKASLSPALSILDAAAANITFGTIIENNLFENVNLEATKYSSCMTSEGLSTSEACQSEPEVISIKSPQNIVRFNTFRKVNGGLTLRHGFQNIVEGNYFFGAGIGGSYGIRVIGDTQVVASNHLQDLNPQESSNFKGALVLVTAQPEGRAINGYWPVNDSVLSFNFLVNNLRNFYVAANYSKTAKETSGTRSGFAIAPERNLASYNYVSSSTQKIVDNRAPSNYPFEIILFDNSGYDQATLGWSMTSGWSQLNGSIETILVEETKVPLMTSSQGVYNNLKVSEAKLSTMKTKQGAIANVTVAQKTRLGKLIDKLEIRDGNVYESIPPLIRGDVGSL